MCLNIKLIKPPKNTWKICYPPLNMKFSAQDFYPKLFNKLLIQSIHDEVRRSSPHVALALQGRCGLFLRRLT